MITLCTPEEQTPFLASKWQHIQFLISKSEMQDLLDALSPVHLFSSMGVGNLSEQVISPSSFLKVYGDYLDALTGSEHLQDSSFRFYFTLLLSQYEEAVQGVKLQENKTMIKPKLPLIQCQLHRFDYSKIDNKIRAHVFGTDTISWGLQASYPQFFQDPKTRVVYQAFDEKAFPNASLFHKFRRWIRAHTLPACFVKDGQRISSSMRIGKGCFSWISSHKDLQRKGLEVFHYPAISH